MAGFEGTRRLCGRRNRTRKWRDRNIRPSGRTNRKIPWCKESHRDGPTAATLQSIKALGADETILLVENRDALENAFKEQFAGGVDIVLDYLWGPSAESLLIAGSRAGTDAPIRFIQIGTASGAKITLSGAILRSTPIELKGSGLGSIPVNRIVRGVEEVLHAAVAGRFEMATKLVPLSEVERVWSTDAYMPRVVFTIGDQHRVIGDG